jgi:rubrerythrin
MNNHISAEEILQIAITIEENGQEFYSMALKSFANPTMRGQIESLASWEDGHIERLKELLAKVDRADDEYPIFFSPEEDSSLYIKAIGDEHVFVQDGSIDDVVKKCNSVEDILRMALRFERDSVAFYKSVAAQAICEDTKQVLITIMEEELTHVSQVEELLNIELN